MGFSLRVKSRARWDSASELRAGLAAGHEGAAAEHEADLVLGHQRGVGVKVRVGAVDDPAVGQQDEQHPRRDAPEGAAAQAPLQAGVQGSSPMIMNA
jgi:hypothetical protein